MITKPEEYECGHCSQIFGTDPVEYTEHVKNCLRIAISAKKNLTVRNPAPIDDRIYPMRVSEHRPRKYTRRHVVVGEKP